ncbi:zinc finger protein 236 [Octopus sinensis]|uniref:Zinc finger protein 236 n=1 Tax=Octopus sinensis TaxID=2607531 RepID=A0A6P7SF64_9MOLL|nr:zinc finger protein 236 [Octopus sinensis]
MASTVDRFTDVNLTDYMDVVTTYKCRFCNFSCNQPQEIGIHVRNVHIKTTPSKLSTISNMPDIEQAESSSGDVTVEEETIPDLSKTQSVAVSQEASSLSDVDSVSLIEKSDAGSLIELASNHQQVIFTQGSLNEPQMIPTHNDILSTGNIVPSYIPLEATTTVEDSLTFVNESEINSQAISQFSVAASDDFSEPNIEGDDVLTKELFLCGQCRIGFNSIEECKSHIVQVHNILPHNEDNQLPGEPVNRVSVGTQVVSTKKKPGRKRKNPLPQRSSSPVSDKDWEEDENSEWYSRKGRSRRKIRPPKALKDDYYLGKKKRKNKDTNVLTEGYSLKCNLQGCFAKFKKDQSLKIHIACHKKDANRSFFECNMCAVEFLLWKHLRMHLWRCHSIDTDLFACENCEFKTDTTHKLLIHKEIHSDQRPYTCDICWKGFKQFSQMRNHQMIHAEHQSNDADRWYTTKQCDICKRTFANQKCLSKHVQAVHSKIKPYVCSYCGHSTARKAMLQLHLRIHTGEKPFKCDVCQYATGDHNSLRRHKMRHSGLRPYKCQYCSYSCIQAISLKTHMKNKHPDSSGIYHCDICNYRTVNATSFTNHVSDHKYGLIDVQEGTNTTTNTTTTTTTTATLSTTTSTTTTETTTNSTVLSSSNNKSILQKVNDPSNGEIQTQLAPVENSVSNLSADDIIKMAQTGNNLVSTDLTAAELIYAIATNSLPQDSQMLTGMQATINTSSKQGISTHTITLHLPPSQSQIASDESSDQRNAGHTLLMVQPLELCSVNGDGNSQTLPAEDIRVNFQPAESSVTATEVVLASEDKIITAE